MLTPVETGRQGHLATFLRGVRLVDGGHLLLSRHAPGTRKKRRHDQNKQYCRQNLPADMQNISSGMCVPFFHQRPSLFVSSVVFFPWLWDFLWISGAFCESPGLLMALRGFLSRSGTFSVLLYASLSCAASGFQVVLSISCPFAGSCICCVFSLLRAGGLGPGNM